MLVAIPLTALAIITLSKKSVLAQFVESLLDEQRFGQMLMGKLVNELAGFLKNWMAEGLDCNEVRSPIVS